MHVTQQRHTLHCRLVGGLKHTQEIKRLMQICGDTPLLIITKRNEQLSHVLDKHAGQDKGVAHRALALVLLYISTCHHRITESQLPQSLVGWSQGSMRCERLPRLS